MSRQPGLPTQSSWSPGPIIGLVFGVLSSFLMVLAISLAHKYHRAHRHASNEEDPNTILSERFQLQDHQQSERDVPVPVELQPAGNIQVGPAQTLAAHHKHGIMLNSSFDNAIANQLRAPVNEETEDLETGDLRRTLSGSTLVAGSDVNVASSHDTRRKLFDAPDNSTTTTLDDSSMKKIK